MRLLFDQNLSFRLVRVLAGIYPDSLHVRAVAMESAEDDELWQYAKAEGLVIVSKDSDFHHRSLLHGFPPKVIWLRIGNCSTEDIAQILRDHVAVVEDFVADDENSFLVLS